MSGLVEAQPTRLRVEQDVGYWVGAWRTLRTDRSGMLGLLIVVGLTAAAVFAPVLAPHPPDYQFREGLTASGQPLGPSWGFLLGTDELGRDELSRLLYGARVSLMVGIIGNLLAALFALIVGGIAGMRGGRAQQILMRGVDVVLSFPVILLAITLLVLVSPGIEAVIGIVALSFGAYLARVVFSLVTTLRHRDFITAAESAGASDGSILVHHLLPHVMPTLLVFSALGVAAAIQLEAVLSFVGLGVKPPAASWGNMIAGGQDYLFTSPWLIVVPGVAIMLALLGFGLLGDGLRDALDPAQADTRQLVAAVR